MKVKKVEARMILDSRGFPTVECDITLYTNNAFGRASVPSGASTGKREAIELRDGNQNLYRGKGVNAALSNIKDIIAPNLYSRSFADFKELDALLCKLDGTSNKSNFGANATLAVSLAFARAQSAALRVPLYKLLSDTYRIGMLSLPKPMFNVINGGAHADNSVDIQEFMVMPQFDDFRKNLRAACEIVYELKSCLKKVGYATNVGDEGGFAPGLKSNVEALDLIAKAVGAAGYKFGDEIMICLDVAASELYQSDGSANSSHYFFKHERRKFDGAQLIEYYRDLCAKYPIYSIEDAFAEDDFEGWKACTKALCANETTGEGMQLVGDDLFVTNLSIFNQLSAAGLANAILIKPNQIGTLTETLDVIMHAKKIGYNTIISHRSGETEDTSIAHIAYGLNAGQIKAGAPVRTDRTIKFNELLRFIN